MNQKALSTIAAVMLQLASLIAADEPNVQQSERVSPIDLQLYGELPMKMGSHVNSIAFKSDNATFALPIDDEIVGVFRIKPETKTRVVPLTDADRRRVAVLLTELDSDEFVKRERATADLLKFGTQIETQLRGALKTTNSAESRFRLKRLLENIAKINLRDPVDRIDQIVRFKGLDGDIRTVEYSPDDRKLLVAGHDQHMRILDGDTHRELRRIRVHESVSHATFSRDGRRIFATMGSKVGIWDAATGEPQATLSAHVGTLFCLDVSADGRWLACSGVPKNVSLWNLNNSKRIHLLEGFGNSVGHVDFSPDGRQLACASEDGTLTIWDVASGKRLRTLRGHKDEVWSVTYSPDGSTISTSGNNGNVVFWDAATAGKLAQLKGLGSYASHPTFSPDGRLVVTAAAYGKTQVWKLGAN